MDIRVIQRQIEPNLPARFRQYVDIRGSFGQLTQFMAVVAGIKPVLDDWVLAEKLESLQKLATSFGLVCAVDSIFEFIDDASDTTGIVGRERLNTTRARGYPPNRQTSAGSAHVFLARDPEWLHRGVASGWYVLVVDGRVMEKPWIDHYQFGESLGYPACCRRFFAFHNDWNCDNSYYQALRSIKQTSFLCNTLVKNSGLSYAVHLPCSFNCAATQDYAAQVRTAVSDESQLFRKQIDGLLKRPFLVLSEWEMYGFIGGMTSHNQVVYQDVFLIPTNRPDRALFDALAAGDRVELERDVVRIYRGDRTISTYAARSERFGPQVPCLIDFSAS